MKSSKENEILYEQFFPYNNMTIEERDFYLDILAKCKDICDSENKVDGIGKCQLVEMKFEKMDDIITANGSVCIGSTPEYRSIDATIYNEGEKIIVDMSVTRHKAKINKDYRVIDEFKFKDNKLKRRSLYNYDNLVFNDTIINSDMKGRLK